MKVQALETERDDYRKSTTDLQQRICQNCIKNINELEAKEREIVHLSRRNSQLEQTSNITGIVDGEGHELMKTTRRELEEEKQRNADLARELDKVEAEKARAERDYSELKAFFKSDHEKTLDSGSNQKFVSAADANQTEIIKDLSMQISDKKMEVRKLEADNKAYETKLSELIGENTAL